MRREMIVVKSLVAQQRQIEQEASSLGSSLGGSPGSSNYKTDAAFVSSAIAAADLQPLIDQAVRARRK